MRPTRGCALAAGTALVAGTAFAGAAQGKPIDRGTFHDEFTEVIEDRCDVPGLTAQHDFVVDGRFLANPHGPDDLVYYLDHTEVTGEQFTVRSTGIGKDQSITDNGDGTLTVRFLQAGNVVLYGPDGSVIARDPGQVQFEFLVDHGGTPTDPSDDEFLGDVKGPTGRADDFCAGAADL